MAFKFGGGSGISLDSPEKMFLDFSDRKLKGLLTHQGKILSEYQTQALSAKDVAIKLPTGSGKTLVGLLIAEWRRRTRGERVVYVCPTKQLVNQVVGEAADKYGMCDWVAGFTGRQVDYDPSAKARFQASELVAVTTYGGLFNANTFFDEPHLIIFDDAHAAENYMASHWTVSVSKKDHPALFAALAGALRPVLTGLDYRRLVETAHSLWDQTWVDSVPTTFVHQVASAITAVFDEHTPQSALRYGWAVVREHLTSCNVYVSANEITVRPLIPPTLRYAPFASATQRLYMSATLGAGGDLERITGVPRIARLSVADDFNSQGVGRRFFIMPGRALSDDEQVDLECNAISLAGRAVALVPDFRRADQIEEQLSTRLSIPIFSAAQIEESKAAFVQSPAAVAVLANRYDGIDFPDEQSRLLIMHGLPGASNLQEKFLTAKMSARLLLADRIQTRVVQAVGRCTRSATDYSAVVIVGEDLLTYLSKAETRNKLHPELQAELQFGLDQSGSKEDMLENLGLFYARGEDWRSADNEIRRLRGQLTQQQLPGMDQLSESSRHEVNFQYALWDGNFARALEEARGVLTHLVDPGLQGYRALWNYLAGNAASGLVAQGHSAMQTVANEYFVAASKAAPAVSWLRLISGARADEIESVSPGASAAPLIARLEQKLDLLGTKHDQRFVQVERIILEGIAQNEATAFENAQRELGDLLGFSAGKVESTGSPDPWWMVDDELSFVFEDYTEAADTSLLSVTKARQAASHPNWIRSHLGLAQSARIVPVLVAPIAGAEPDAAVHLQEVAFWHVDDFRAWAKRALAVIRELRVTYPGAGDLIWRQEAMSAYVAANMDPESLLRMLQPLRGSATFGRQSPT